MTSSWPGDSQSASSAIQRNIESIAKLEEEFIRNRTLPERIADAIGSFAGSLKFVALHIIVYGLWIGLSSLAHDIAQERAPDAPNILERVLGDVSPTGTTDRYQYTGTYHGVIHSHLDAVDCHVMVDGKGYNGRSMEDIKAAGGCPKGNINALKDGVVTRGILFDATRLPGKATPQGWLEPGTAVHREDLEALEKLERVKVSAGDVILLYTGRWKRRAALGPWPNTTGFAGYHADVAYFLKERGVSFIAAYGPNDVW